MADAYDVTLISNNTRHVWYIHNVELADRNLCLVYHKHHIDHPYRSHLGTTLRIRFKALESTLIDQPKTPNRQGDGSSGGIDGGLAERIIDLIRANNTITVLELSEALETPKRTIEREMNKTS